MPSILPPAHKENSALTTDELDRALRQLRLGGIADSLSVRTQQAQTEKLRPLDFLSLLIHDELQRRRDRLVERHIKAASSATARHLIRSTGSSTALTGRSSLN